LKIKGNYRRCLSHTSFDSESYSINVGFSTKKLKGGISMSNSYGGGFALLVVLFILLIIIGATSPQRDIFFRVEDRKC
jgi:uncharacterized protein (TIGR01732 family)